MPDTDTPELIRQLLRNLGEYPEREGLRGTPQRVADSLAFLLCGYRQDPEAIVGDEAAARMMRRPLRAPWTL